MLNFVIAILSSTFNKYENIKIGLYYNVLIELFDKMSWDDKFGCLVCAQQPLNVVLFIFSPLMVIFNKQEEKLQKINEFICHVLYFPFALIITSVFTVFNILIIPIGYTVHVIRLLTSVLQQPSLWKLLMRLILTIQFAFYGLIYFPVTIVVDMLTFFFNLYTYASIDSLNENSSK
jgi:hypothetical protein